VIQGALLTAVHAQPAGVVTLTVPLVALSAADTLDGEIVVVQGTPCCVTVTAWPAIVTVPLRDPLAALAAIVSETVPLPVPEAPLPTVIQAAPLTAVHAQLPPAVTETDPVVAGAETDRLVVESVYEHGGGDCVTENVCPPAVMVAVRGLAVVLAAMA
jgi:hypothetical protein